MVSEMEPVIEGAVAESSTTFDLQRHEAGLLGVISHLGLPTEAVLVPVPERQRVFAGVGPTLDRLSAEYRSKSVYLSKLLSAVASGLFDAALNYLWDEVVGEIRRRVAIYDIEYFFDVAVGSQPERRKKLSDEHDLTRVEDQELIIAAQKMGLISDVGYRQLDLVRYMRNHASAAHPNQVDLRALQILEYLETCIVEVITLPETQVVSQIRRLLANVKKTVLSEDDCQRTGAFFTDLDSGQAASLARGLFGIYAAESSDAQSRTNVRLLFPHLWPHLADDVRGELGVRYARYSANGDVDQARLSLELITVVGGQSYLPESTREAEIDAALDALSSAHYGWNNFAGEVAPAQLLRGLVGESPTVPKGNRVKYVHTLVDAFLGNMYGVSWAADRYYQEMIEGFTTEEAYVALRSFATPEISAALSHRVGQRRWTTLIELLRPRLVGREAKDLLDVLDAYSGPMDRAANDTRFRRFLSPSATGGRARDRNAASR